MQLVIEISEVKYNMIKGKIYCGIYDAKVYEAIANGTPLPKGHGRLIAEPTEDDIAKTIGGRNDFADIIRDCVKIVFNNAPTIISADIESEV